MSGGGYDIIANNELLQLKTKHAKSTIIISHGEVWYDSLYTVPGETENAGKRILTNYNDTKMLIEETDEVINESYKTHWFDTGIVKPVIVKVTKTYYTTMNYASRNIIVQTNYDLTKTKLVFNKLDLELAFVNDYDFINNNYNNVQHFLKELIYNHDTPRGNDSTEVRGIYTNGATGYAKRGVNSLLLYP